MQDIEAYLKKRQSLGIKPGLERMTLLLERLGHPEKNIRIIHVTGTNGKGSTVECIAQSLIANGYKVGVFSSPSFTGVTGHFLINGKSISEHDLINILKKMIPIIEQIDEWGEAPTSFEIITAMSFLYFQNRVDVAIIEAGMGGRFDTTNGIDPILSVITSIALDHESFLGNTLEQIAYHKAGIIKPNRPVIVGPVPKEAEQVIHEEVKKNGSPIFVYGTDYIANPKDESFVWRHKSGIEKNVSLSLKGTHQLENASVAMMTLLYIEQHLSLMIDWEIVLQALKEVSLPGRFERLVDQPTIIVDSAHNVAAIKSFIHTVQQQNLNKDSHLLFAGFRDKQIEKMVCHLQKVSDSVTLTTFDHERAARKKDYHVILNHHKGIQFTPYWQQEIEQFLKESSESDTLLITGSLHFVMLVRQFIKKMCS